MNLKDDFERSVFERFGRHTKLTAVTVQDIKQHLILYMRAAVARGDLAELFSPDDFLIYVDPADPSRVIFEPRGALLEHMRRNSLDDDS